MTHDVMIIDRTRELETENALLRARVAELRARLDDLAAQHDLAARRGDLDLLVEADDDADDSLGDAFEAFLAVSDPHLDKVRRFLIGS